MREARGTVVQDQLPGEPYQLFQPLHRKGVWGPVSSPALQVGRQGGRQASLGLWLVGSRCSCLCHSPVAAEASLCGPSWEGMG